MLTSAKDLVEESAVAVVEKMHWIYCHRETNERMTGVAAENPRVVLDRLFESRKKGTIIFCDKKIPSAIADHFSSLSLKDKAIYNFEGLEIRYIDTY